MPASGAGGSAAGPSPATGVEADRTLSGYAVLAALGAATAIALAALAAAVAVLAALLVVAQRRRRRQDVHTGLLAAVLDSSGDAIVSIDEQGCFTTWNASASELLGYTREEALGRPVTTVVPDEQREDYEQHLAALRRGETVLGWETVRRRPDGSVVDVDITASALRDGDGRIAGAIANIRDISERKSAEHRFQSLLEAAPDGIVIVDEDGRITLVNAEVERMFGYAPDELVGEPVERLLPVGLAAAHRRECADYQSHADVRPMSDLADLVGRHRDGHEIPVEVSLSPMHSGTGMRVIAAVRDVTERRRAAHALAESEERFRRSFHDSGVGMALVVPNGASGDVLEMNEALTSLIGYTLDEYRALGALAVVHPDDLPPLAEQILEINNGATDVVRTEVRLIDAQGSLLWTAVTFSLVRDSAGDPVHVVVQVLDVGERTRFQQQLQYLADHDSLTGLYNRRRFEQELEREVTTARRYGHASAVLVLDLDHFKLVNDSLGHAAGDDLITVVASLLTRRLRQSDIIGRMGGDEFAIILPRADEAEARRTGEILLREVRADAAAAKVSGAGRVTASVGVSLFGQRSTAVGAEELLAEADIAMYDAKEAGRDRLAVYDAQASRHSRMQTSLAWVGRVEEALAGDRFVLHAQPILPVVPTAERRYELLLRMVGDDGDLIPPATFLQVAERHGLAVSIDRWVIARAAGLLAEQQRLGRDVCFAVNLSAVSVADPAMLEFIGRAVSDSGVDPHRLVIEVTETAAIVNVAVAKAFVQGLRAIGCQFAIDDFGAGFASFYYLKHLSFDYLKIDGEFIRDLTSNHTNQLVVRSVAEIARGLGRRTVAEFVGSTATLQLLREYGVDYAQGFFTGRPQAIEDTDFTVAPLPPSGDGAAGARPATGTRAADAEQG